MFGSSKTNYFILVTGDKEELQSMIDVVQSFGGSDNLRFTSYEMVSENMAFFRYSDHSVPRLEPIREFSKKFETLRFISMKATEVLQFSNGQVHDLSREPSSD